MAIAERQLKERHEQELAGLDALETVVEHAAVAAVARSGPARGRSSLAIAIVLGGWQLVVMSGWKSEYILPVAVHGVRAAVGRTCGTAELLDGDRRHDAAGA